MSRGTTRRVVVTGMGVVSPLGHDPATLADNLLAGRSGASRITVFDSAQLPTRIAAEVKDFASPFDLPDRKIRFGLAAARSALSAANRHGAPLGEFYPADRRRLSFGIGLELFSMPDMILHQQGKNGRTSMTFLQTPSDLGIHLIGRELQATQPPLTHVSACAASTDAVGAAMRLIRSGRCDCALAGGTDSMINPMGVGGFCSLRALTTRNDAPEKASRPFDRDRDGFLLGEGAGALVLESEESAQKRGAKILAEVVGFGNSFDAYGISEPHPEAEGALLAMQRAVEDAGIAPEDVVHVNAHGTSTPKNDPVETLAIRKLFGAHADRVTVNATKSMIGHLISASGAVEIVSLIACAGRGYVHPTVNLDHPDPRCDLDYVRERKRGTAGGYFLKNSFAFGGQNASLVLKTGAAYA